MVEENSITNVVPSFWAGAAENEERYDDFDPMARETGQGAHFHSALSLWSCNWIDSASHHNVPAFFGRWLLSHNHRFPAKRSITPGCGIFNKQLWPRPPKLVHRPCVPLSAYVFSRNAGWNCVASCQALRLNRNHQARYERLWGKKGKTRERSTGRMMQTNERGTKGRSRKVATQRRKKSKMECCNQWQGPG